MNIKQTIKIFIQGDLMVEKSFTDHKKAFKWFEERFDSYMDDFKKAGYKDIESSDSYHVLLNTETKSAVVISYENIEKIDINDVEGNPIILNKPYKGNVQIIDEACGREYDTYRFGVCGFGHNKIYLRNETCWNPHIIKINGYTTMSKTIRDLSEEEITQELINKLNLTIK